MQIDCNISAIVPRRYYITRVEEGLSRSPIVALLGPRQAGKTTLARQLLPPSSPNYFDMEDPESAAVMEQPKTALAGLRGLVVIDEAQRRPDLFPVLRVLADREDTPVRFLILGSASPSLARQASESLAGRIEIIGMRGFSLDEVGKDALQKLWIRGGFPKSFLAKTDEESSVWRKDFVSTFLERDLAKLGFHMAPAAMHRFWKMVSHYHGQLWNGSEIASSMGVAPNTARSYLDALEQTFMIRRLQPWYANVGKRLVKTPKIYFRDSGIFHQLQGIRDMADLLTNPKLGASWEGLALEEVLHTMRPDEAWFYSVHSGAELDLFTIHRGRRIGVEFKRQDAPRITRSMRIAITDLGLDELWVVYPGEREYELDDRIRVLPLASFAKPPA